eukprot:TRINITY_DN21342_c0_g1_i1.p1 TRINITY_DN21342_c0_g1~~TRINITY_DN21342_c0_g1_i1.p1  ORF type:complete len:2035 (-),score=330.97 TRINITY_DN21342_c0_g1_i1:125-6229(-)
MALVLDRSDAVGLSVSAIGVPSGSDVTLPTEGFFAQEHGPCLGHGFHHLESDFVELVALLVVHANRTAALAKDLGACGNGEWPSILTRLSAYESSLVDVHHDVLDAIGRLAVHPSGSPARPLSPSQRFVFEPLSSPLPGGDLLRSDSASSNSSSGETADPSELERAASIVEQADFEKGCVVGRPSVGLPMAVVASSLAVGFPTAAEASEPTAVVGCQSAVEHASETVWKVCATEICGGREPELTYVADALKHPSVPTMSSPADTYNGAAQGVPTADDRGSWGESCLPLAAGLQRHAENISPSHGRSFSLPANELLASAHGPRRRSQSPMDDRPNVLLTPSSTAFPPLPPASPASADMPVVTIADGVPERSVSAGGLVGAALDSCDRGEYSGSVFANGSSDACPVSENLTCVSSIVAEGVEEADSSLFPIMAGGADAGGGETAPGCVTDATDVPLGECSGVDDRDSDNQMSASIRDLGRGGRTKGRAELLQLVGGLLQKKHETLLREGGSECTAKLRQLEEDICRVQSELSAWKVPAGHCSASGVPTAERRSQSEVVSPSKESRHYSAFTPPPRQRERSSPSQASTATPLISGLTGMDAASPSWPPSGGGASAGCQQSPIEPTLGGGETCATGGDASHGLPASPSQFDVCSPILCTPEGKVENRLTFDKWTVGDDHYGLESELVRTETIADEADIGPATDAEADDIIAAATKSPSSASVAVGPAVTRGGRSGRRGNAVSGAASDAAIRRLEEELGDTPRICVLGSVEFQNVATEALTAALARQLSGAFGENVSFLTGGMPGVQRTFAEHCGDRARLWNLLPEGEVSGYGVGRDIHVGSHFKDRRRLFGRLGDIYVVIEGGPGVAFEARSALLRGAAILPLKRAGGAGGGLFDFPMEALQRPPCASEEQWSLMGRADVSVEESAAAAVQVVKAFVMERWAMPALEISGGDNGGDSCRANGDISDNISTVSLTAGGDEGDGHCRIPSATTCLRTMLATGPVAAVSGPLLDSALEEKEQLENRIDETAANIDVDLDCLKAELGYGLRVCILGEVDVQTAQMEALVAVVARQCVADLGDRACFITAGRPGVQRIFAEHCAAAGAGSRLWHLLAQGETTSGYGVGQDRRVKDARINGEGRCGDVTEDTTFAGMGDIYIVVGGGPGAAFEARSVFHRGAGLVPVPRVGGAGAGMFDFPVVALERPPYASELHWSLLANSDVPVETSAFAAAAIVANFVGMVFGAINGTSIGEGSVDEEINSVPNQEEDAEDQQMDAEEAKQQCGLLEEGLETGGTVSAFSTVEDSDSHDAAGTSDAGADLTTYDHGPSPVSAASRRRAAMAARAGRGAAARAAALGSGAAALCEALLGTAQSGEVLIGSARSGVGGFAAMHGTHVAGGGFAALIPGTAPWVQLAARQIAATEIWEPRTFPSCATNPAAQAATAATAVTVAAPATTMPTSVRDAISGSVASDASGADAAAGAAAGPAVASVGCGRVCDKGDGCLTDDIHGRNGAGNKASTGDNKSGSGSNADGGGATGARSLVQTVTPSREASLPLPFAPPPRTRHTSHNPSDAPLDFPLPSDMSSRPGHVVAELARPEVVATTDDVREHCRPPLIARAKGAVSGAPASEFPVATPISALIVSEVANTGSSSVTPRERHGRGFEPNGIDAAPCGDIGGALPSSRVVSTPGRRVPASFGSTGLFRETPSPRGGGFGKSGSPLRLLATPNTTINPRSLFASPSPPRYAAGSDMEPSDWGTPIRPAASSGPISATGSLAGSAMTALAAATASATSPFCTSMVIPSLPEHRTQHCGSYASDSLKMTVEEKEEEMEVVRTEEKEKEGREKGNENEKDGRKRREEDEHVQRIPPATPLRAPQSQVQIAGHLRWGATPSVARRAKSAPTASSVGPCRGGAKVGACLVGPSPSPSPVRACGGRGAAIALQRFLKSPSAPALAGPQPVLAGPAVGGPLAVANVTNFCAEFGARTGDTPRNLTDWRRSLQLGRRQQSQDDRQQPPTPPAPAPAPPRAEATRGASAKPRVPWR